MIEDDPQSFPVLTDIPDNEDVDSFNQDIDTLEALAFPTPAHLLMFVEPTRNPHMWQMEELKRIADDYTQAEPLKYNLRTCNGSGKDSYIVAATVAWLTVCKIRHRTILTSSSGGQLTTQTEQYIDDIFKSLNRQLGCEYVRVRQRRIKCEKSGSEVILFATDEAGRAEGFHPFPTPVDAEMCIIINEAKSVDKIIVEALNRCTGYNRWINVSSPGVDSGSFYESCMMSIRYPETLVKGKWYERVITVDDCPHISKAHIEGFKESFGEASDLYKSSILAEFGSSSAQVVITTQEVRSLLKASPKEHKFGVRRAGLDLSASFKGDECVLSVWHGNTRIGQETWKEADTTKTTSYIITLIKRYGLKAENVNADDGGVGRGIIDQLHERGYPVTRVLNQWPALINKREFSNRGAEMWFNMARFIQEGVIILPHDDDKLIKQLTSRLYKRSEVTGKIVLESKPEAKARGAMSPDRADAMILAFANESIEEYLSIVGHNYSVSNKVSLDDHPREVEDKLGILSASAVALQLIRDKREIQRKGPSIGRIEVSNRYSNKASILHEVYKSVEGDVMDRVSRQRLIRM